MHALLSYDDIRIDSQPRINPHLAATTSEIEEFCKNHHIWLPQFGDYHTMTAYLYPRTTPERLIALNIFMNLLWFIDDKFDDMRLSDDSDIQAQQLSNTFKLVTNLLINGDMPDGAAPDWLVACAELRKQVVALGNEKWLHILAQTLHNHLQSITATMDSVMANGEPDLDAYLAIRQRDSGMMVAIEGIEFAYDFHLPDELRYNSVIVKARDCAAHIGGLMNDLMSYHHDERDNNPFNLIMILRQTKSLIKGRMLPAQEGIHEAVLIINHFIYEFEACERQLPIWHDETLNTMATQYMQGLRDQIDASYHWQLATGRYRSPDAYYHRLKVSVE